MFEWIRSIGQIVVLLYVVSAMIVIGLTKAGGTMASITKTSYAPDSHRLRIVLFPGRGYGYTAEWNVPCAFVVWRRC